MKTYVPYLFQWLLLVSCEPLDLLLYHSNNIYSHFEEDKSGTGGAARALHVLTTARRKASDKVGPPVLYLNAGDNFGGSYLYHRLKWRIVADVLDFLKPDVMCLGNHDFDEGPKNLTQFLEQVRIPVVGANIDVSKEEGLRDLIKPYHLISVANWTIGIIGYTTTKTNRTLRSGKVQFTDELEAVRRESRKLRMMGIKIIIALGHAGQAVDERIAKEVEDVDIVVGGHRKSWMINNNKTSSSSSDICLRKDGKKVLILYEPGYLRHLGMARIYFNQYGDIIRYTKQPIFLHSKIPQDRRILNLIQKNSTETAEKQIGTTRVTLSADCLASECNLGNLMVDALCEYMTNMYTGIFWTDYPIALINSGIFRESMNITDGKDLTNKRVANFMHFDDLACTMEIKGRYLKQALEESVIWEETSTGQLLQVAGVLVEYNFLNEKGSRIERVYLRCHFCKVPKYFPLDEKRFYRIITTYYVAQGADGHYGISDNKQDFKLRVTIVKILEEYIARYGLISPNVEDRMVIKHNKCSNLRATQLLLICLAIKKILAFYSGGNNI